MTPLIGEQPLLVALDLLLYPPPDAAAGRGDRQQPGPPVRRVGRAADQARRLQVVQRGAARPASRVEATGVTTVLPVSSHNGGGHPWSPAARPPQAAGLAALFAAAPTAFTALRLAGAAYLLYLGVRALRSAWHGRPLDEASAGPAASGRSAYLRGLVTNMANPKSVTFVVALLPQFVDRAMGHVPLQFAVLGAIFVAFELLIDGTVAVLAGRIGRVLSRRRRARQALDAGSGTIMVALAGRLALEH